MGLTINSIIMHSSIVTIATLVVIVGAAPGGHYRIAPPAPTKNIAELAIATPQLSTLLAAVKAAGLVDTLAGEGPFTVFAPTNDAFAKIPEDTLNGLLGDVPALTEILLRHVVPGKVVKLYSSSQSVDNAGGSQLTINGYSVASSAASAGVIGKSVASDGRVYAINTVI